MIKKVLDKIKGLFSKKPKEYGCHVCGKLPCQVCQYPGNIPFSMGLCERCYDVEGILFEACRMIYGSWWEKRWPDGYRLPLALTIPKEEKIQLVKKMSLWSFSKEAKDFFQDEKSLLEDVARYVTEPDYEPEWKGKQNDSRIDQTSGE